MKTPYEVLENLRNAETLLLNARYDVLNTAFKINLTNSEYQDLMNKTLAIIGQAEELKNNLYNS
jgi:hypothetical protein